MKTTLKSAFLLSDLHLDVSRPELTRTFLSFLQGQARTKPALFLLGDIFEVWVGDDDDAELSAMIAEHLHATARSGTDVHFMHGNRDFLLGAKYANRAGMALIDDPYPLALAGIPTLLSHGDRYCIDDAKYQAFRRQSRDPQWQAGVLSQPLMARRALAASLRAESTAEQQSKIDAGDPLTDVVDAPILVDLMRFGAHRLIHGHTHRPDIHFLTMPDGQQAERIVLSDWHDGVGEAMAIHADGSIERHRLTDTH